MVKFNWFSPFGVTRGNWATISFKRCVMKATRKSEILNEV